MNESARQVLWGVAAAGTMWLAAAWLWSSYEAVPGSLFVLAPLGLAVSFLAGWRHFGAPRGGLVVFFWIGLVGPSALLALLGLVAGAAWMPVEPVTFAALVLLASPALTGTAAAAHALSGRRHRRRPDTPAST